MRKFAPMAEVIERLAFGAIAFFQIVQSLCLLTIALCVFACIHKGGDLGAR